VPSGAAGKRPGRSTGRVSTPAGRRHGVGPDRGARQAQRAGRPIVATTACDGRRPAQGSPASNRRGPARGNPAANPLGPAQGPPASNRYGLAREIPGPNLHGPGRATPDPHGHGPGRAIPGSNRCGQDCQEQRADGEEQRRHLGLQRADDRESLRQVTPLSRRAGPSARAIGMWMSEVIARGAWGRGRGPVRRGGRIRRWRGQRGRGGWPSGGHGRWRRALWPGRQFVAGWRGRGRRRW
jgi:hypothetical protein